MFFEIHTIVCIIDRKPLVDPECNARIRIKRETTMKHSITRHAAAALLCAVLGADALAAAPGRLVDIGGRSLHVVETPGASPVVVLEAGGGAFSSYALALQAEIRDQLGLRVINYDRAGLGWSDPAPMPYRIEDRADELDALLTALDVQAPVVLVASSYGGWVAQAFASRHAERLGALVLVDPNSSHFFTQYPEKVSKIEADGTKPPPRGLKRIGLKLQRKWLAKHAGTPRSAFDPILTERHQLAVGGFLSVFGATSRTVAEHRLPQVPTIMISRGRPQKGFPWGDAESEAAWRRGHETLIEHLMDKQHWIAENSGHGVVFDQPELIIEAIASLTGPAFSSTLHRTD